MQDKNAVLLLGEQGKSTMALPGPGGYTINWSPGTKLLTMEPAESGHLMVSTDNFTEIKGAEGPTHTFFRGGTGTTYEIGGSLNPDAHS